MRSRDIGRPARSRPSDARRRRALLGAGATLRRVPPAAIPGHRSAVQTSAARRQPACSPIACRAGRTSPVAGAPCELSAPRSRPQPSMSGFSLPAPPGACADWLPDAASRLNSPPSASTPRRTDPLQRLQERAAMAPPPTAHTSFPARTRRGGVSQSLPNRREARRQSRRSAVGECSQGGNRESRSLPQANAVLGCLAIRAYRRPAA